MSWPLWWGPIIQCPSTVFWAPFPSLPFGVPFGTMQVVQQIRPRHAVAEGLALATCTWTHNLQVVRSCLQLSPRYGAALPARRYPACRCNLAPLSSFALVVPVTRRTTIGDRAFAVVKPRAWNSLPQFVTDCSSTGTFRKYLKKYLFSLSF